MSALKQRVMRAVQSARGFLNRWTGHRGLQRRQFPDKTSNNGKQEARRTPGRGNAGQQDADFRPLDPDSFHFHGFGDLIGEVERSVRNAGIRGDEPEVSNVEGAVFVPAVKEQTRGTRQFSGGVLTADGQSVDFAQWRRGRHRVVGGLHDAAKVEPEHLVDEEALYLGWLFPQFGPFLLDALSRAWYLKEVDPSVKVVFHLPPPARSLSEEWEPEIPSWVLRVLGAFGVPRERILVPEAPTRFRRLIVPEPLFSQGRVAHEEMIRPFREAASRIVGDAESSEQPVYLSRRLLSSRRRPIVGEKELEDMLRENGFLVVYPETMTLEDQVRLVNRHEDIFANAGSAAHSVLFALGNPRLHLLTHGAYIHRNFYLCSALAGTPTAFINCLGTRGRPIFASAQLTPLCVEPSNLLDYLEERGFLKERQHAALLEQGPTLQNQYNEAWFYARIRSVFTHGETLPAKLEAEAIEVAAGSWPVSLVLALYYARSEQNLQRANDMVEQFAKLLAADSDASRGEHYRTETEIIAELLADVCGPETAARLSSALPDGSVAGLEGR